MRKSVKVILIIASSLVGIGVLFLGLSLAFGGMNLIFMPSGISNYTVLTATFDEVDTLEIKDVSNDVRLVKSDNDEVKVTYGMSENFGYYLKQIDGTLIVEYDDFREWYEFIGIFSLRQQDLIVEVPEKTIEKLSVKTVSGNIRATEILASETVLESTSGNIEAGGNVGKFSASAVSGDIKLNSNTVAESVKVSTTSGELSLSGVSAEDAKISSTSGDVELKNANLTSVDVNTMSGEIDFNNVVCSGDMDIDTTSGDIDLEKVDAENYTVNSTSGEIDAKILSDKIYNVSSVSGSIDVPKIQTVANGYFNAETTSGDIEIELVNR